MFWNYLFTLVVGGAASFFCWTNIESSRNRLVASLISFALSWLLFCVVATWSSLFFNVLIGAIGIGILRVCIDNFSIATHWKHLLVLLFVGSLMNYLCCIDYSRFERILRQYYPELKEVVSIEKIDHENKTTYKFTIIEYCGEGTNKRDGFIDCRKDGTVFDVSTYGNPYEFRDGAGKEYHSKYGIY